MKKIKLCLTQGGRTSGKEYEKLSGDMETFYIMKGKRVSCVHLIINTVQIKFVNFNVCKFYPKEVTTIEWKVGGDINEIRM